MNPIFAASIRERIFTAFSFEMANLRGLTNSVHPIRSPYLRLLGHLLLGVVNLGAQIPHRALKLGVAQKQLDSEEVLRAAVD